MAGTGLTGGGATGSVTLNVDAGTGANQIVQLDGSARLPAVDGSQLTGVSDSSKLPLAGGTLTGSLVMNSAGAYIDYRPNAVACADGEVLKWVAASTRWECGTDTAGTGDFLANGTVAMTGNLNMGAQNIINVGTVDGVDVSALNTTVGALTTTDIPEGANLYFTDARAKTAAVVDSTAGSETDQAPSVAAMKSYVLANGGVGDFLKDGSVAMTGNLDLGTNELVGNGGTQGIYIGPTGNVGIGTNQDINRLDVEGYGQFMIGDNTDSVIWAQGLLRRRNDATSPGANFGIGWGMVLEGSTDNDYATAGQISNFWEVAQTNDTTDRDSSLSFFTMQDNNLSEKLRINSAGNLSIKGGRVLSWVGSFGTFLNEPFIKGDALGISMGVCTNSDCSARSNWLSFDSQTFNVFSERVIVPWGVSSLPGITFEGSTSGKFSPAFNEVGFSTVGTERMRIDTNGNVGIGKTTPGAMLDVNGDIRATQICDELGGNCKDISTGWGSGSGDITEVVAGTGLTGGGTTGSVTLNVDVGTTAGKIVQLDGTGKLPAVDGSQLTGISATDATKLPLTGGTLTGTLVMNTASAYLDYRPNAVACADGEVLKWVAASTRWECGTDNTGGAGGGDFFADGSVSMTGNLDLGTNLLVGNGGTSGVAIDATGNVGVGTTTPSSALEVNGVVTATNLLLTSDARYKRDIEPLDDPIEKLMQIEGVSYFWDQEAFPHINFSDKKQFGFIAQEIRKVYPEVVNENSEGMLSVNYPALIPAVVEAIKKLTKEHAQLKDENNSLKREIASLKEENAKLKKRMDKIEAWIKSQKE